MTLVMSTPPPEADQLHTWVLDDHTQLHHLRASLFEAVTGQVMSARFTFGGVADKMALVATELAGNALKYGLPPTIVHLYRCGAHLIIDIADHDTQMLPEFADASPVGAGGLGLRLATEYALTVGWFTTGTVRHVWAQFSPEDNRF